jgi:ribose transport system ATP-binding protein
VLATSEVEKLFALIKKLKEKGTAIIYITHRLNEVFELSDRITVLRDGQLVKCVDKNSVDDKELVNMMIGRNLHTYFPKREPNIKEELFRVEHIRSGRAVKDVSFSVHEGEVLGICGLVGAGRTEAVRAIVGADILDGGHIFMKNKEIKIKSPKDAMKQGVALLAEDRKGEGLLVNLPIRVNMTLTCLNRISNAFGFINKRKETAHVEEMITKLNIIIRGTSSEFNVSSLSGGNQQKVAIAKLLSSECKVVILDEPTRGVDVGAKIEIFNIINALVAQDYAVVMISSETPEIIGICDRAIVIREGVTVGEISKDDLSEQNLIKYSMGVNA